MSALGETLRALRARGFTPVAAKLPVRAFKGGLACKKGDVSVKLTAIPRSAYLIVLISSLN